MRARCGFLNRVRAGCPEVFQGNPFPVACGRRNERLTDAMIGVSTKPRFPSGGALERPTNVLGTFAVHLGHVGRPLQPSPALGVARATGFNAVPL